MVAISVPSYAFMARKRVGARGGDVEVRVILEHRPGRAAQSTKRTRGGDALANRSDFTRLGDDADGALEREEERKREEERESASCNARRHVGTPKSRDARFTVAYEDASGRGPKVGLGRLRRATRVKSAAREERM